MNNWKDIWEKRTGNTVNESILQKLISADGFDTGYGTIEENDWIEYVKYISDKLEIENNNSLYEVGCGSGAFLYHFWKNGNKVGGLDYSNSLIKIAKQYLTKAELSVSEADKLNSLYKYDFVVSNSVFFYFSSYEYANVVISKMIDKANNGIAILEVNDYDNMEESMQLRKGSMGDEEYKKRYHGLEHLYYKKQWFMDIAKKHNLKIEIEKQNINNYANNAYRFNVFMYKD